jgi:predicted alpha/beta-fold hydrolase
MLSLYMIKEQDKTPLNGAIIYGMPYNLKDNVDFFKASCMKLFDLLMGFNFYTIIKS